MDDLSFSAAVRKWMRHLASLSSLWSFAKSLVSLLEQDFRFGRARGALLIRRSWVISRLMQAMQGKFEI